MKHLKFRTNHLRYINLKNFNYPKIWYIRKVDTYGDGYESHAVFGDSTQSILLYYMGGYVSPETVTEIKSEVALWNSDPKKYWTDALIQAYKKQEKQAEDWLKVHKKKIKKARKALKRLQKET